MSAAEELARRRTKRRRTPLEHVKFKDAQPRLTDRSVIKGWLERDQLSLIFGPTGCGKTFLTLDLSLHVAWGRAWGGSRVVQGAVVYVAVEAGKSISNRLVAFRQHHRLEALDLPFHAVTSPIDLCHLDVGDVVLLGKLIREVADLPALVVIDTVSRAMAGGNGIALTTWALSSVRSTSCANVWAVTCWRCTTSARTGTEARGGTPRCSARSIRRSRSISKTGSRPRRWSSNAMGRWA